MDCLIVLMVCYRKVNTILCQRAKRWYILIVMEESKCDHRVCSSAVWTEAVYSNMWGTFPWMFACGLALFFLSWGKFGVVTRVQTQHPGIHPST